jgi:hypothetical protein
MSPAPAPSPERRRGRARPQPAPGAWSAALRPSQRRAAERRAAAEHQLTVQRWLRDLARR